MREGLGKQPRRHTVEAVAQHRECIGVTKVTADIEVERFALDPLHNDNGKFLTVALCGVDKQFVVKPAHRYHIRRRNTLQFLGDSAVALGRSFLRTREALDGVELARLLVAHLEYDSEITARHHRFAATVKHRPQRSEFTEIVLRRHNRLPVFRNQRIVFHIINS